MSRLPLLIMMIVIGGGLAACEPSTTNGDPFLTPQDSEAGSHGDPAAADRPWPYWPRSMRVHPLTRWANTSPTPGIRVLEARVEFLDRNGHTAKCFGNLRLDLHDAAPAGRSRGTLATWNLDLTDLDVNTVHYDDITRTYLFKLEVSDTDLPQEPELRLYYIAADGRLIDTRGSAPSAQPIGS